MGWAQRHAPDWRPREFWRLVSSQDGHRPGVNCHIGQDASVYGSNAAGVVDNCHALGFRLIRDNVSWSGIESAAGVYNFSGANVVNLAVGVQRAHDMAYDIDWCLVLAQGNPSVYGSIADATWRGHFVDYVEAICNWWINTKGWNPARLILEVWNEPEGAARPEFNEDAEAHLQQFLIEDVWSAVKAVNSSIRVAGPTVGEPHFANRAARWADWFANASDLWAERIDILSTHVYDFQSTPETQQALLSAWRQSVLTPQEQANGGALPHFLSEWGWTSESITDEVERGRRLSRGALLLAATMPYAAVYELIDSGGEEYGIYTAYGVAKAGAPYVSDALEFVNGGGQFRYYKSGDLHAVVSGERCAIWATVSTYCVVTVHAEDAGTLSMNTFGGGTATSGLSTGRNNPRILATTTPVALTADVPITWLF